MPTRTGKSAPILPSLPFGRGAYFLSELLPSTNAPRLKRDKKAQLRTAPRRAQSRTPRVRARNVEILRTQVCSTRRSLSPSPTLPSLTKTNTPPPLPTRRACRCTKIGTSLVRKPHRFWGTSLRRRGVRRTNANCTASPLGESVLRTPNASRIF